MGVEYYIVNIKNKTFYDLGKGGWYCLRYGLEDYFQELQDPELLTLFIMEEWGCDCNDGEEHSEKCKEY